MAATPTPAPVAAVAPPTPAPTLAPNWDPSEIDPEASVVEEAADALGTPVPLLWLGSNFPLWWLLVLLLVVLVLSGAVWRLLRRNREYY